MNASQKVTAAAMALVITLTGAIAVTAPVTLPVTHQCHPKAGFAGQFDGSLRPGRTTTASNICSRVAPWESP